MMGWNRLVTLTVAVLLVASFLPMMVSGVNDSLNVVMTIEDKDYKIGDTVTVNLWVYDNGVLADVQDTDTILLNMTVDNNNFNNPESLPLEHPTVGHYRSEYKIQNDDLYFYFWYFVKRGSDFQQIDGHQHYALRIDVLQFHNTCDVNFDGQEMITAQPGDVVTATIEVRYGNDLIQPNTFNELWIEGPDGNRVNLTEAFISQGIYETTYTIPDTYVSGIYSIHAAPDTGGNDDAMIFVNVMDVWYRQIDIVGSTATFEIGVADMEGQPIDNATVYVKSRDDSKTGTTNGSGLVLLSLTDVWGAEDVDGFVVSGVLNQSFSGVIMNEQAETPAHNGFDILYNGETSTYKVSDADTEVTISRQYTAYYNAAPQANRQIYYYVTASGTNYGMTDAGPEHIDEPFEVTSYGVATTDAGGKFTLDFTAPSKQSELNFYFESGFTISDLDGWISDHGPNSYDGDDNLVYEEWPEHGQEEGSIAFVTDGDMKTDANVKVKANDFTPGEPTDVTVTMPAGYDDSIMTMWVIGEVDIDAADPMTDQEWFNWAPGGEYITLTKGEGNDYTGTYTIPTFIDADSVFVYSGYNDGLTGFPHYNYDTASEAGGMDLPMLWIIIIVVIIAAAGIGLIWYFKNN